MSDTTEPQGHRKILSGQGVCTVCDQVVALVYDTPVVRRPLLVSAHWWRDIRCPGGGQAPRPWVAAAGLPYWPDMTDLDRGGALMHAWKCWWERSAIYAREHYPARYHDDPLLVGLEPGEACRHALIVTGGHEAVLQRLGHRWWRELYETARAVDAAERMAQR